MAATQSGTRGPSAQSRVAREQERDHVIAPIPSPSLVEVIVLTLPRTVKAATPTRVQVCTSHFHLLCFVYVLYAFFYLSPAPSQD